MQGSVRIASLSGSAQEERDKMPRFDISTARKGLADVHRHLLTMLAPANLWVKAPCGHIAPTTSSHSICYQP